MTFHGEDKLALASAGMQAESRLLRVGDAVCARGALVIYIPTSGAHLGRVLLDVSRGVSRFVHNEMVSMDFRGPVVTAITSLSRTVARAVLAPKMLSLPVETGTICVVLDTPNDIDKGIREELMAVALNLDSAMQRNTDPSVSIMQETAIKFAYAAASEPYAQKVMDGLLAQIRTVLAADVAYISCQASDDTYKIEHTHGIRTDRFRNLRIRRGDALGGKAIGEGRPIISSNYLEDAQLLNAKLEETREEGIISALAVPIRDVHGRTAEGALYIGNRSYREFGTNEVALLSNFSQLAYASIARFELDESRREECVSAERTRLAQRLHDTVLRQLLAVEDSSTAIEILRKEIDHLVSPNFYLEQEVSGSLTAPTVVEVIEATPGQRNLQRSVHVSSTRSSFMVVPKAVAQAFIAVGCEAVANAERHCGGRRCEISLLEDLNSWTLRVVDDGRGFDGEASSGFGLLFMRTAMESIGGSFDIYSEGSSKGTSVVAKWTGHPSGALLREKVWEPWQ